MRRPPGLGPLMPLARARQLERAGDWAAAATALEKAVARNPSEARLRLRLARACERQGRWEEAAQAYRAALALADNRPRTFARLGRVLLRQQRWDEAADAYSAALALDDGQARWHFRLGKALAAKGRWGAAAEAYGAALALDDSKRRYRVQLGLSLERAGDVAGARRTYDDLLERDPGATSLDQSLLAAATRRFPARRRYGRFITAHLDEIRERASAVTHEVPRHPPRIWVYWGQGMATAPAIVRRCHEQLMRYHAADEVVLLDDRLVPRYVEIPEVARRRTAGDRTKFSDVLRLELLSRYGGIWLDATCFVRRRLLDLLPELLPSGFFAFRYRTARISSWLLASEPNHPVVAMAREAQYVYWEHFRRPIDYSLLHHLFESLYYADVEFRDRCEPTPFRSSHPPARFARAMLEPYDRERFHELLDGSFVHKLTYKFPPERARPGTHLARLMGGEELDYEPSSESHTRRMTRSAAWPSSR